MAKGIRITHKSIIFWAAIITVTIGLAIAIVAAKIKESRTTVRNLSEIEIKAEEMLDYETRTYVFLYDSTDTSDYCKEVEDFVIAYATRAVRENKIKVYTIDVSKEENKFLVNDHEEVPEKINTVTDYEYMRIRSKKIPILLIVDTKKVSYYKTGLNSIKQEMQTELEKVQK